MDQDTALMLLKTFGASPLVEGLSIMEAGAMPNASLENTLAHARTTEARIQQGNDGLAKALNKAANGISKGGLATALGNASAATDQAPSNEGPPSVAQDNTIVVQGNGHGASQAQVGEQ